MEFDRHGISVPLVDIFYDKLSSTWLWFITYRWSPQFFRSIWCWQSLEEKSDAASLHYFTHSSHYQILEFFFFLRGVVTDRMDIFFCKLEISIKIILRKKKGVRYALIFKKSYFLKGIMNIGYILNSIFFFQWQSCNSSFMMNQHYWIKLNFSHSIEQFEEDSSYCISYIWDCKWWMNIFKI